VSAAIDFAEVGEDLVTLVANLARATQGRFDGQAGTALAMARSYVEAAVNGFAALAASPLTDAQRLAASNLSSGFRDALGILATHFAGRDTYTSYASLSDRSEPERNAMEAFFSPVAPPLVEVSIAARGAIETLRRDPLDLVGLGSDGLRQLMQAAADGVTVRPV
jgi:hypothetical protein